MIEKIWTSPDGKEYTVLPKTWGNTSGMSERWALAHGWTYREEEIPDPVPVFTYSKFVLHLALGQQGLWDAIWASLDDEEKQLWNDCQVLQSDNPFFLGALEKIKNGLHIDEDLIEKILEESQI